MTFPPPLLLLCMTQWNRVPRSFVGLSMPLILAGLGMWSQILSSSTFRPHLGSAFSITVMSVLGRGMAFMILLKVSGLTFDLRIGILKCILERILEASPASLKMSITSSSVELSQPSSTFRYRSNIVWTWCLTEVLTSPPGNRSNHCRYTGTFQVIYIFKRNFFNLGDDMLVCFLAIHMDKLPEDLSLPDIPSFTLIIRHAASVWYSQPTLLNFKETVHQMSNNDCTWQQTYKLKPNFTITLA